MHVSGAVVTTLPGRFEQTRRALEALAGVDVHDTEPASRRLVITIEAESIDQARELLEAVQRLPSVAHAELVIHHTGD